MGNVSLGDNIERRALGWFKSIDTRLKVTFFSALVWGVLAHGMALFNRYSIGDDLGLFGIGAHLNLGRWLLLFLAKLYPLGTWPYVHSLPLINGLFCIVCIALSACLCVHLLDIKHWGLCIAISGVMIAFPSVTGLFGVMFTAPFYMLALLMTVCGTVLLCRRFTWPAFISGNFLICCAAGIYQAYIPVSLSLMLFWLLKCVVEGEVADWVSFLKRGFYLALCCSVFMLLYFAFTQLFLWLFHVTLSSYKGMDKIGQLGLSDYLFRLKYLYRDFLHPGDLQSDSSMYPMALAYCYQALLALSTLLSIGLLYRLSKTDIRRTLQAVFLMGLIPLSINFIFIMCDSQFVFSLMIYGQVMFLVYFAWLVDKSFVWIISASRQYIYIYIYSDCSCFWPFRGCTASTITSVTSNLSSRNNA